MTIDTIAISDIKPYEKNAKSHPKKQVDLLAENITRFGFTTPCLVDKDNNLIAGHGRLEAVKMLGWSDVPCVRMENLTENEVKALRLADNKLAEMSEWDMALVTDELKELDDDLLDLTGFDKDLLIEPDEADDVVPEVPEEPQSKLGDLYELGNHRVLCGDSTKIEDVERLMDGKKADMVFTSPPYNAARGKGSKTDRLKGNGFYSDGYSDNKTSQEYIDFNERILSVLNDALNGEAYLLYNINYNKNSPSEYLSIALIGQSYVPLVDTIIWEKQMAISLQGDNLTRIYEFIFVYRKGDKKMNKGLSECVKNLWKVNNVGANTDNHKACFPIELARQAVDLYSQKDEIVIDPFLGSGSTLIAAEKTGRICYGMELDPRYVDVIVQRYVDYTCNATIKLNGEEIVWKTAKKQQES